MEDEQRQERERPELTDALIEEAYRENRRIDIEKDLRFCRLQKFGNFVGCFLSGFCLLSGIAAFSYLVSNQDVPDYARVGSFAAFMGAGMGLIKSIADYEFYNKRIIRSIQERK